MSDIPDINAKSIQASYVEYDNQNAEWLKILADPEHRKLGETWFKDDTIDAWRHERMRAPIKTFVQDDLNCSWLTVGDGRFGTDANFLLKTGAINVHCSDYSDTLLKMGNSRGFITSFSAENAESLRFGEAAFDYVYCKEAFHHFPRPYIALNEMFRVAKKAVIITEPRDQIADRAPLAFIFYLIKAAFRRGAYQHSFEPVGNYVYTISEREIDKFLLGMHYNYVAYIGCNDAYIAGVEFALANSKESKDKKLKRGVNLRIGIMNFLCRVGVMKTALITAALFKAEPSEAMLKELRKNGWVVRKLPKNPYR